MRTLVIVPTYNERDNLGPLVEAILPIDPLLDVLVVDDASPDGTGLLADALAARSPRVHVIHRPSKMGLGTAYIAGFRHALAHDYGQIVEMDADFSHRPEDLPRLLEAAEMADVVVGSRNVPGGQVVGWSPLRQVLSRGGSSYTGWLLGMPVRDCTSGFMCLRRGALEALNLDALQAKGYAFEIELKYACARAGLRIVEVPITFPDRVRGTSKLSWRIIVEAMLLVAQLRFRPAPLAHPAGGSALPPTPLRKAA